MAFQPSESSTEANILGHFSEENLRLRICYSQGSIYCEEDTLHFRVPLFLPPYLSRSGNPAYWQCFLSYCFGQFLDKRGLKVMSRLTGGGGCFSCMGRIQLPKHQEMIGRDEERFREHFCRIPLDEHSKEPRISFLTNIKEIPDFAGRVSELSEAKEIIESSRIVTIAGPAGSGKTALATTLAFTFVTSLEVVWKCTADSEASLAGSLKQLAAKLKLGDGLYELINFLNRHQVLLLLDNLDFSLSEPFRGLVEGNIRMIVTSRKAKQTNSINIGGMDMRTAVDFVIKRTERHSERQDIEALCRELAFMPLALKTASALLNFSPREKVHQLLQWIRGCTEGNADTNPRMVQLLEKCVKKVPSKAGKRLLVLTLDLSPDVIPEQLYNYLFSGGDGELEQAKREAQALSLIEEDEQHNLSVHPLMKQAVRHCYSDQMLSSKVQALLHLFTCEERSDLSINLSKSVQTVVNGIKTRQVPTQAEMSLCIRFVYFCMKQLGTLPAVTEICNKCCVWWENRATVSEDIVSDLEYLAICCKEMRCYRQATLYLSQVIDFRKRDKNKEKLAAAYRVLGNVHSDQGNKEDAILSHLKSLKIKEAIHPPPHSDLALSYVSLAVVYRQQGKLEQSEQFLLKAQKSREENQLFVHPDLALSYFHLAVLLSTERKLHESENFHLKALEIREAVLPPTHPDLAQSYHSLASVYEAQGRLVEAEELNLKALHIRETILPRMHEDIARSYINFATLYQAQGKFEVSAQFYLEALKIKEAVLYPMHPDLGGLYNNLGNVFYRLEEFGAAEKYHLKALQICESDLNAGDLDLASSYNNLAAVYQAKGKLGTAEEWFLKALKIREAVFPSTHPDVISVYKNLAILYKSQGKVKKEEQCKKKANCLS